MGFCRPHLELEVFDGLPCCSGTAVAAAPKSAHGLCAGKGSVPGTHKKGAIVQ